MKALLLLFASFVSLCLCWDELNKRLDEIVDQTLLLTTDAPPKEIEQLWERYRTLHGGAFTDECKKHFIDNVHLAIKHNCKQKSGKCTYKLGINRYSHMCPDEFKKVMNGFRRPEGGRGMRDTRMTYKMGESFPGRSKLKGMSVDWRKKGVVTPVKDQGMCGSCYAFSATGALEGMFALSGHNLTSLSEQQIVDCSNGWGNHGCDGGLMDQCFEYIHDAGGIQNEKDYPYNAMQSECRFVEKRSVTSCDFFVDLPENDENALMEAVYNIGPISVAIDAGSPEFMSYREGIYNDSSCSPDQLNHGVLLIGYGTEMVNDKPYPYWLVKNSWGTTWGEKGYIKMSRFQKNICGIASYASYPLLKKH